MICLKVNVVPIGWQTKGRVCHETFLQITSKGRRKSILLSTEEMTKHGKLNTETDKAQDGYNNAMRAMLRKL